MSLDMPDVLELRVQNDLVSLGTVLDEVEAFLVGLRIAADPCAQVMLIVDELASNVVKYAWPTTEVHSFLLRLRATPATDMEPGLRLVIELEDDGVAFDPAAAPVPDLEAPLGAREEGGVGWLLVRSMTDEFAHRRADGRNHLRVGTFARLA